MFSSRDSHHDPWSSLRQSGRRLGESFLPHLANCNGDPFTHIALEQKVWNLSALTQNNHNLNDKVPPEDVYILSLCSSLHHVQHNRRIPKTVRKGGKGGDSAYTLNETLYCRASLLQYSCSRSTHVVFLFGNATISWSEVAMVVALWTPAPLSSSVVHISDYPRTLEVWPATSTQCELLKSGSLGLERARFRFGCPGTEASESELPMLRGDNRKHSCLDLE
ncbi:hypothetical protein SISSUDRAFT_1116813 [Sistotremastrum suecicum HHB10207 ss-3]|uniref:Uncharacterized protein n=1 Tax=Sistotremastrum suecicum HHB10207 ss-3 TaxID=1314776 RepID=A0A166HLK4_9AGAM|nr:hypothetical protein SISSUDRAFT_1116813 [Sistotremastrum suecicum HHB10207 ss-3]